MPYNTEDMAYRSYAGVHAVKCRSVNSTCKWVTSCKHPSSKPQYCHINCPILLLNAGFGIILSILV